jgi:hypothetical protein
MVKNGMLVMRIDHQAVKHNYRQGKLSNYMTCPTLKQIYCNVSIYIWI